jgi:hypothetical protein
VTLTRIREMLLPNRDPRIGEMSILSNRIDNARLTEGVLLYLASVGLVAGAIIVLYSVASFSLLGTSKETLIGSRIDNNPIEDVSIGTVVFYPDSNAAPVPVQTKSPNSSGANHLPSSTLVPPLSGMSGDAIKVEPALKPLTDGETSAMAVETPHGSTVTPSTDGTPLPEPSGSQPMIAQPLPSAAETSTAAVETPHGSTVAPSTDGTPPPEPSGSQPMIAQPLPSAAETSTAAVETPHGSTVAPSTDETPSPEPNGSQQVIAQPPSIADEASAAQHASGPTMPWGATPDGQLDQTSQNFELQSNYHADLDEGTVAVTTENRLPETQVKEIAGYSGSTASAGSNPRLLHAASRGPRAVKANRDKIADQLNHAELSRLLGGGRAPRRAARR